MYDVTRVSRYVASAQGFVAKSADDADIDYAQGGFYAGAGTAAAPSLTFFGDTDTGLYRSAANTLGVSVAGALDFSFSANAFNVLTSSSITWADSATLVIGTGSDDTISHNGTNTLWAHVTGDLTFDNQFVTGSTIMLLGTDTTATDFQVQNNSAVAILTVLPESASGGTTVAMGLRAVSVTAAAIATTRTLTAADSGGVFSVAKTSAYGITLPTPAQGLDFTFMVLDTGANIVTISDGAAHLNGIVFVNSVGTVMTGTTISLASGGALGDWVRFQGIDATHYLVTGACLNAADITVA